MYIERFWDFSSLFFEAVLHFIVCHDKTKEMLLSIIQLKAHTRNAFEHHSVETTYNKTVLVVTIDSQLWLKEIWLESPFEATLKSIKSGLTILQPLLSSLPSDSSISGKLISSSYSIAIIVLWNFFHLLVHNSYQFFHRYRL